MDFAAAPSSPRLRLWALLPACAAAAYLAAIPALLAVRPWAPQAIWKSTGEQGFWAGATSAFYGGIIEELLLRWGVLTALLALARKLGARDGFWTANILAAALFGLGHLPAALQL